MRILGFVVFFAVAVSILSGVHYYLWLRLVRSLALPNPWRQVATGAIIALALSLPATFILDRVIPADYLKPFTFVPFLWMGAMFIMFSLLVVTDAARLLNYIASRVAGDLPLVHKINQLFPSARAIALGTVVIGAGLCAWGLRAALFDLRVERVEVALTRFPKELDGFKIVQITDLHAGAIVDRKWIELAVEKANALDPDLIAVTGDVVDGDVGQLYEVVSPLKNLKADHGVFFVTGNHEYYSGVEEWLVVFEKFGFRILRNERVRIGDDGASFDLAGVDDQNARGMAPGHGTDLEKALKGRDPKLALVLLAHQPKIIKQASEYGVDLVLSGHTHGGQLWPWNHLVRIAQPYISGLHKYGHTWIYVSQGTGFWGPPIRLGTRNEITEIILRAK
jgi:predicted MPP superfamily phosphohydrolase